MWNKLFLITLLFASSYGRLIARTATDVPLPKDSVLAFTDFRLFNKSVAAGQKVNGRILLPATLNKVRLVSLNHHENVLSFEFTGPLYNGLNRVRYAYMMEGFDKGWTFFDENSRNITYTNLDPGKYTLRIRSAGTSPVKAQLISIGLLVMPPFWHSPLAYLIYSISILCLLFLFRKWDIEKRVAWFDAEKEKASAGMRQELILMKKKFFTSISHEFKVPLINILAPADKLLAGLPAPEIRGEISHIKGNAKLLLTRINQLIEFRKIEYQEMELHKTPGDLVAFIENLTLFYKEKNEKETICLLFDSEVPEFHTAFDHDKIERILLNLLSNAYKFTPADGRISVLISFIESSGATGTGVEITVIDTGTGISEAIVHRIFEPFFQQGSPVSESSEGIGIGLSVVRDFVKIQGGTISMKSEPGTGTSFCISIPFIRLSGPSIEAEELTLEILPGYQGVKVASSPDLVKRPAVLLVEGNDELRQFMKAHLQHDFTVLEAVNGKEGWQKALTYVPGLVIAEIQLPGSSGIDLCLKIRRDLRTSHMKVMLLASGTDEKDQVSEQSTGATEVITKPFNLQLLGYRAGVLLRQAERTKRRDPLIVPIQPYIDKRLSADGLFMQTIITLTEQHLANPKFTLEEFSTDLFMSRYTLYKKVLALTGKTPVEFVRSVRMKKATRLLESGTYTMAEICLEVGFKNQKLFERSFRTQFNILPANFLESTLVP